MNKKYAITGHTSGIRQALFNKLKPDAIGFSLSSGFDITNIEDRYKIIDESRNCDIFINNAGSGFSQTLLFLELLAVWHDNPSKTIINVGSRIAEIVLPIDRIDLLPYQSEKILLKSMSNCIPAETKCAVKYKWFAYVGTPAILKRYPAFTWPNDYITMDEACQIILN